MAQVVIDGWRPGILTISCILALRQHAQLSLKQAKDTIEAVLSGSIQVIEVPSSLSANILSEELCKLGAQAHLGSAA